MIGNDLGLTSSQTFDLNLNNQDESEDLVKSRIYLINLSLSKSSVLRISDGQTGNLIYQNKDINHQIAIYTQMPLLRFMIIIDEGLIILDNHIENIDVNHIDLDTLDQLLINEVQQMRIDSFMTNIIVKYQELIDHSHLNLIDLIRIKWQIYLEMNDINPLNLYGSSIYVDNCSDFFKFVDQLLKIKQIFNQKIEIRDHPESTFSIIERLTIKESVKTLDIVYQYLKTCIKQSDINQDGQTRLSSYINEKCDLIKLMQENINLYQLNVGILYQQLLEHLIKIWSYKN